METVTTLNKGAVVETLRKPRQTGGVGIEREVFDESNNPKVIHILCA